MQMRAGHDGSLGSLVWLRAADLWRRLSRAKTSAWGQKDRTQGHRGGTETVTQNRKAFYDSFKDVLETLKQRSCSA